jgi:hypothetical protein
MIPYEVDPSLHSEEPHAETLDDGFSRPDVANEDAKNDDPQGKAERPESLITEKSDF